eukprot:6755247-Prymnesium_polylepis.1
MFQQTCGVNAIVYFTPQLLREAGVPRLFSRWGASPDAAALLATVLAYIPKIPAVLLSTFLIDRLGRRELLATCMPLIALCLGALATSFDAGAVVGASAAGAIATVAVTLFGVFFGMSLGPIPNILASELFPTYARSTGVAACTSVQWGFNIVVAASFPALQDHFGSTTIVATFSAMSVIAWLFILRFVPETRGVALEDMEHLLTDDASRQTKARALV